MCVCVCERERERERERQRQRERERLFRIKMVKYFDDSSFIQHSNTSTNLSDFVWSVKSNIVLNSNKSIATDRSKAYK